MGNLTTVVAAQATTANSTGVEMNVSPALQGKAVRVDIVPNGFSGTAILEGSVDNSTWTTLKSSGALTTKYTRSNVTRSAGSVSIYLTANN